MTLINIKFNPEMERAIIEGRKCCTTRHEIKGNIGDLFRVKDRMYRIIQVDESDLLYSSAMANAEGFKSDIEYLDCMSEIYPDLDPDLVECSPVFIHYFAYAGEWCPQFGVNGAVCSVPERLCDLFQDCRRVST
jgi:hypothetical protein